MKILVLGGTGAMGIHLVKLLSERGDKVFVTSRREQEATPNITYLKGDAHNDTFLESLLHSKWDAIVDFMVYTTDVFSKRVGKLLEATTQYIYLSSSRVYADSEEPITEESPRLLDVCEDEEYLKTDEYALTKARQENILYQNDRRNFTIIRPYITYSENRLQLGVLEKEEWLFRALQGKTIVFSEEMMNKKTTLTYGYDVAKAIVATIGNNSCLGEAYHPTIKHSILWKDVLTIYLDVLENHLGYRPKVKLCSNNEFFQFRAAPYQIIYDRFYHRIFNNNKISKVSNTSNFINVEDGLERCLETFLIALNYKNINWSNEARMDKLTKENLNIPKIGGVKNKLRYIVYRTGIK